MMLGHDDASVTVSTLVFSPTSQVQLALHLPNDMMVTAAVLNEMEGSFVPCERDGKGLSAGETFVSEAFRRNF
jgi:hypothetical protein